MTHDSIRISTLAAMVEEVAWDQSSSQKAYCKPLTNQVMQPLPSTHLETSNQIVQRAPVCKSWIRQRFQKAADLQNYVHNMFDLIYMLEYLEGQSIVNKLSVYQKMAALRKIENKYVKDPGWKWGLCH